MKKRLLGFVFGALIAQGATAQLELDDDSTFGEARDCVINDTDNDTACDTAAEDAATGLHEAVEDAEATLTTEQGELAAAQGDTEGLQDDLDARKLHWRMLRQSSRRRRP